VVAAGATVAGATVAVAASMAAVSMAAVSTVAVSTVVSTAAASPAVVLPAVVFTAGLAAVFTTGLATGFTADMRVTAMIRTALGTAIIRITATESPRLAPDTAQRAGASKTVVLVAGTEGSNPFSVTRPETESPRAATRAGEQLNAISSSGHRDATARPNLFCMDAGFGDNVKE
jgi:hypothetical protein